MVTRKYTQNVFAALLKWSSEKECSINQTNIKTATAAQLWNNEFKLNEMADRQIGN